MKVTKIHFMVNTVYHLNDKKSTTILLSGRVPPVDLRAVKSFNLLFRLEGRNSLHNFGSRVGFHTHHVPTYKCQSQPERELGTVAQDRS